MKINTLFKLTFCFLLFLNFEAVAQLDTPRGSQMASVSQRVGITDIYIKYSRPSVNDREIWGKLVPFGMNNLGFGTAKESPWRAGANENTIIKFTNDVTVEGQPLSAGKYGLHMVINSDDTATIIFSKNYTAWGSYFYEPSEDALRVDVKMKDISHVELLTFTFNKVTANTATAALQWEKKEIPFTIGVDVPSIVVTDIKKKLQNQPGFNRQTWEQAAGYVLNNGGDYEEALGWINDAIQGKFFSQQNFNNTSIKAGLLTKLGKKEEALALMDEYMPKATVLEAHQYGRQLINQGMKERALEVFKLNAKNHKNTWPVDYGLARGYSALGNYTKALKHIKIAHSRVPDAGNKAALEANWEKLKKGEDIN